MLERAGNGSCDAVRAASQKILIANLQELKQLSLWLLLSCCESKVVEPGISFITIVNIACEAQHNEAASRNFKSARYKILFSISPNL
jgi:hypothetical protein